VVFLCDWCWKVHTDYRGLTVGKVDGRGEQPEYDGSNNGLPSHTMTQMHACTDHAEELRQGNLPPSWPKLPSGELAELPFSTGATEAPRAKADAAS
jgi:hypothetical protein